MCVPGEEVIMNGDPCSVCICGDDGKVSDNCPPVGCTMELLICGEGTQWQIRPGTCCVQECVGQGKIMLKSYECVDLGKERKDQSHKLTSFLVDKQCN